MFENILFPTDGSKAAKNAFECAAQLAVKCGSKVHVLFVAETVYLGPGFTYDLSTEGREKILESGKKIVESAREEMLRLGVKQVECLVKEGHPAEVILNYTKEAEIDVVVMGTHGRRRIERALMGSITREVVSFASVPVLVVRRCPS